jgi:hypothetical protein
MRRNAANSLSSVPEGENSESDHSQDEDEDEINAFAKHLGMDPNADTVRYQSLAFHLSLLRVGIH